MIPPNPETQAAPAAGAAVELNEFESLLNKEFRARDVQKQSAVATAVRTLAEQALSSTKLISADTIKTIQAIIAEIDKKLSEQINRIMHHEDFKALEGTWRGLHYLVNNTETDENLKIRVLNIPKNELKKTLKKFEGTAWDQSPIFKKLYEEEFGSPGGQPYGCLIGDYYFDHSPEDVKMLANMGQVAAAAHAPFMAAASPTVLGMDSWQELSNLCDLIKII
jgi:type VI secretion system protein ImpC